MFPKTETALAILHQTLTSCSKSIGASDYNTSVQSVEGLIIFLNSICDATVAEEHEPVDSQNLAIEILNEIHQYLASPALSQEIIDALAFEVPKAVARFACLSTRCLEVAEDVVDLFIGRCSPRDLLSILCDAMASPIDPFIVPSYFMPLLSGLTKVVVLIQRRHYEQVKTAVPVILKVLTTICSTSDDVDSDYENLFHRATGIAHSIREICIKMEGKDNKKIHDLLGLYVLQLMALVSVEMPSDISRCLPLVLELSDFLQHCELTYIGLLTGLEVDMISNVVCGDDGELGENCFSQVKLGAVLAVIWGYKASEVAVAAKADLTAVLMELQGNWARRWEAVGMLKHLFSCSKLSWELRQEGIKFLLCIMDGIVSHSDNDTVDYSIHLPTMFTSLQAIQVVILYSSDSEQRKNALKAFRKLLADIPTCGRFDVLMVLVKTSDSSSMIGILLDCIRGEMHLEKATRNSSADGGLDREGSQSTPFWNPSVLELVEMVLRPPQGGPPSLLAYSDAKKDSFESVVMEHLRLNGAYWGLTTLDVLGRLDAVDQNEVVSWLMQCQHESGGFGGNMGHDPHLYTLSAIQVLALFDKIDVLDVEKVANYIASLQNEDGSFSGDIWGEIDTRFSYIAICSLALLRCLGKIDKERAVKYIVSCKNLDGGFGCNPGAESHAGQIFCCVGALAITGSLHHVDKDLLGWWLCERQVKSGGLNGRPEKLPDVCYSWWVLSSLIMIDRVHWIDKEKLVRFILDCQDKENGGISDRPDDAVDVFHTYFGVAGLSLLEYPGLKAIDPAYALPVEVINRIFLAK